MADLRLYALGIDEARAMWGADAGNEDELREILQRAFPPAAEPAHRSVLGRLGSLLRTEQAAPTGNPSDPTSDDIDAFLAGDTPLPERVPAGWRIQETLVAGRAWGSTRLPWTPQDVDDIDFALARGGVSAAVGLRHLFSSATQLSLVPVRGLTVGWHDHGRALAMGAAFREALAEVPPQHQESVAALVTWLDGFGPWAEVATSLGRPVPDLLGFWVH